MEKLPTYQMVIDPSVTSEVEVAAIAFVDKPAIERNFLAFKTEQLHFAVDVEKRIVSGPAMIPDSLIYRRDAQGEYNVFFSAQTIQDIALKFFKKDYQKNLNLFHDPNLSVEGVTIFESFISDSSRGVSPMKGFKDLPDGTWFISAKVENDQVWEKIKSGEVKGFSVEGIFSFVKRENRTDDEQSHIRVENNSIMADLKEMFADLKKTFFDNPIVAPAAPAPEALATEYTRVDGTPLSIDKLEVGGVCLANGAPCPAGPCELQDGTKLTIGEGGVITEVSPAAEPEMPMAAPDFSAQFTEINEKFAGYEAKFAAYEDRFAKAEESLNKANGVIVSLMNIVEKLAATPTADPVGENKSSFSAQKIQTAEEKRKALAENIHALKSKNK